MQLYQIFNTCFQFFNNFPLGINKVRLNLNFKPLHLYYSPSSTNTCSIWCKLSLLFSLQSSGMHGSNSKDDSAMHFVRSFHHLVNLMFMSELLVGSIMPIFTENSLQNNNSLFFFYQHVNNSLRAQLIFFPLRRFCASFYL